MKLTFKAISLSLNVIAIEVLAKASLAATPIPSRDLWLRLAVYIPTALLVVIVSRKKSKGQV